MEIHLLDWIIYFFILVIVGRNIDDGDLEGYAFLAIFTIIYVIIFSFFNWIDFWNYLVTHVTL